MSLRGKDFRCEIDADLHEHLRIMAEFHGSDMAAMGSRMLEKAIAGEFHEFTVLADRLARSGILRTVGGISRNDAEKGAK